MAINVVYGVDPTLLASAVSSAAGSQAAAEQQRYYDQLDQQQGQFNARMGFDAQMAALEDDLRRRQMAQQSRQFNASQAMDAQRLAMQYGQNQQDLAARFELEQQRIDAQNFASEQATRRALAGELGQTVRQREQQKFQAGLSQKNAIDDAFQRRQITTSQRNSLYGQLGDMYGFDVARLPEIAAEEQQAQAEAQQQQMQGTIANAFAEFGGDVPDMARFMTRDSRTGETFFDTSLLQSEVESRRNYKRLMETAQMNAAAKESAVQAKAVTEAHDALTESHRAYLDYEADRKQYESDLADWSTLETGKKPQPPNPVSYSGFPLVRTEDDMRSLPSGTYFITPSGTLGRAP